MHIYVEALFNFATCFRVRVMRFVKFHAPRFEAHVAIFHSDKLTIETQMRNSLADCYKFAEFDIL